MKKPLVIVLCACLIFSAAALPACSDSIKVQKENVKQILPKRLEDR